MYLFLLFWTLWSWNFFNFYFNFSNYMLVYKGSLKGQTGQELFSPYSTDEGKRLFLKL